MDIFYQCLSEVSLSVLCTGRSGIYACCMYLFVLYMSAYLYACL